MSKKVIFGHNAVSEALRAGHHINRIYFNAATRRPYIPELKDLARENGVRFDFVDIAKLNTLAGTGEHQDVVAVVSPVEYASLDDFIDATRDLPHATLLVLDQVQHSGNMGIAVRSAVSAGVNGVLLTMRGGSLINDQVFRASAGAIFHIPIIQSINLATDFKVLKEHDFWVYGLDATGQSNVFEEKWAARSVIVVGNEHEGLRPVTRKACDLLVRIPMIGDFDSLNVSVAASIVMFQITQYHARPR